MTEGTSKTFEYKIEIKENYLDFLGHVNNAKYFELLEEARWDFLTSSDFGLEDIRLTQISPVVLEATIRYKKEIRNREKITIYSTAIHTSPKIFKVEQTMKNEGGEECAVAIFTCGFMDMKKRKLVDPPIQWKIIVGAI